MIKYLTVIVDTKKKDKYDNIMLQSDINIAKREFSNTVYYGYKKYEGVYPVQDFKLFVIGHLDTQSGEIKQSVYSLCDGTEALEYAKDMYEDKEKKDAN